MTPSSAWVHTVRPTVSSHARAVVAALDPLLALVTVGHVTVTSFGERVPECQVKARAVKFDPVVPEVMAVG